MDKFTIFCDIGGVLVPSKALTRRAAGTAARRCARLGFAVDPLSFAVAYLKADRSIHQPHMSHIYGERTLALAASEAVMGKASLQYVGAFLTYYREHIRLQIRPRPELTQGFASLAALPHVRLGVISDGSTDGQLETLTRLEIIRFFDPDLVLISEDFGTEKDTPDIYVEALRRAATPPGRTFMIGDNFERDVSRPLSMGMRAIYFSVDADSTPAMAGRAKPDLISADFNEIFQFLRAAVSPAVARG
jgi:FMN phosphatase YigB (HAD superfamily)